MMFLPLHLSPDPAVNRAANVLCYTFGPNPYDWRGTNDDKTIAAVMAGLRMRFGDFAGSVKISVH